MLQGFVVSCFDLGIAATDRKAGNTAFTFLNGGVSAGATLGAVFIVKADNQTRGEALGMGCGNHGFNVHGVLR